MSYRGWTAGEILLEESKARAQRRDPFEAIARKLMISRDQAKDLVRKARQEATSAEEAR